MKFAIILGLFMAPQLVYPQLLLRIRLNSLTINDTIPFLMSLSKNNSLLLHNFAAKQDSLFISVSYSHHDELIQLISSINCEQLLKDLSNYFPNISCNLLTTFDGFSIYSGIFFEERRGRKRRKMSGNEDVTLLISAQQNIRLIEPFYNYKKDIHGEKDIIPLDSRNVENLHHYILRLQGAPMLPRRKK